MALPPLYKYLSVEGAKKTLGNNAFRHAKPSSFNDIEDPTVAPAGKHAALIAPVSTELLTPPP